jgi:hypothetical protein
MMTKQRDATIQLAPAGTAVMMVFAACSVTQLPGPKYVPQSTTIVGTEPRIPSEWFGCWRGTVEEFDSVTPISPSVNASDIKALSTTYDFCFSKRSDGTGKLDLTDVEIGRHKATVTHFDNHIASTGPDLHHASLHNHTTVESVVYVLWIFPIHMTDDIYAEEDLQMLSPDVIYVKGKELLVMGGNMVASTTFHTNFYRVGGSGPAD